jgi:hypothetical protein
MAACNFTIPFSGAPQDVLRKAQSAVEQQGGTFNGDPSSGNFQVSVFGNTIRGSYSVQGQALGIVIDSKPFLIPCSTIEGFLKSQIGG